MSANMKYNGYAEQDGDYFSINNVLDSLKRKMTGGEGAIVMCPMCEFYDVVINLNRTINNAKCRRCHNKQIWRKTGSRYKVKTEDGIYYANEEGFTRRESIYD